METVHILSSAKYDLLYSRGSLSSTLPTAPKWLRSNRGHQLFSRNGKGKLNNY